MFKKSSLTILLLSLLASPMFCVANTSSFNLSTKPTNIHNTTNEDIAYMIRGTTAFNKVYAIKKKHSDVYHAGVGDDNAVIEIGICKKFVSSQLCDEYLTMKPCSSSHYNINDVSDITISDTHQCTIRCRDGSSSSCKR